MPEWPGSGCTLLLVSAGAQARERVFGAQGVAAWPFPQGKVLASAQHTRAFLALTLMYPTPLTLSPRFAPLDDRMVALDAIHQQPEVNYLGRFQNDDLPCRVTPVG